MLHQIRKMVHLAACVVRGLAPVGAIATALSPSCDISIPMAPELGLFLDACIFKVLLAAGTPALAALQPASPLSTLACGPAACPVACCACQPPGLASCRAPSGGAG